MSEIEMHQRSPDRPRPEWRLPFCWHSRPKKILKMCMIIFEVRRGILMRFEARLEWNEFQTNSEKHEKEKFYSRKSSHGLYNFLNNSAKRRLNINMNVYLAKIELDRVSIWRLISLAPFFRRKLVMRISMLTPSINYHRSNFHQSQKIELSRENKFLKPS